MRVALDTNVLAYAEGLGDGGFTWRGVTVVNPFETKAKPYKLLASVL